MPLTYNQINGITRDKFIPKLYDNVFNSNPLLQRLKEKSYKKLDGGNKILIPLEYDDASASGWYSGAETLSVTDNEVFTAAAVDWCQLYASVIISGRDKMINMGDSQVIDFVAAKIKNAEKTMAQLLSTGLYSDGTDAKSIVGLRDWVATDQTVGGISQSTYSWYQGQVDSTSTTLTMSVMQTLFNACVLNNMQPSVAVGTKANYNRYYALLQPQQRFVDTNSAKGGWTSLMFNGIPFLADTSVPANHLFFLYEECLHLFVHRERDMFFTGFKDPIAQDVEVAQVKWMGAFGSSNNRAHGKFSALTA
jgi:hypothetical protein